MTKILVGLLLSLVMNGALADWYGIVGVGKTRFPTYYGAGQWQQVDQGFAFVTEEMSNSWTLGAGRRINNWLSVELAYTDLGQYNSAGRYTSDASYAARCTNDCAPTATGWHHGTSKAFEVSAMVEYWHLFGRIGAGYHQSEFVAHISKNPADPIGRDLVSYTTDGPLSFGDRGYHAVIGAGVRVAQFRFEYQMRPLIADGASAYHDAGTWLLSFEIPVTN